MLIQFSVENFFSFKDKTKFSMAATSLKELPENVAQLPDTTRVLKTAVIYGPNAAGKSNLIHALRFLRDLIRDGTGESEDNQLPEVYFRLDKESVKRPTRFVVDFIAKEVIYKYAIAFTIGEVVEESLYSYPHGRPRLLFDRKEETVKGEDFGPTPNVTFGDTFFSEQKAEEIFLKHLKPHALLLSVADFLNIHTIAPVFKWFTSNLFSIAGTSRINERSRQNLAEQLNDDEDMLKWVKERVNDVDLSIHDLYVFELKNRTDVNIAIEEQGNKYDLNTIHNIYDKDGKVIGKTPMPWGWESKGTELFITLLPRIYRTLNRGGVLLLDELGAQLHPFVMLKLIQLFNDPITNPKNAQLIFTTHVTTLLDNDVFRRDQIWFVEKKKSEKSTLYSLAEFSPTPRKGEALEKGYLQGRYGALPFVGELKA